MCADDVLVALTIITHDASNRNVGGSAGKRPEDARELHSAWREGGQWSLHSRACVAVGGRL